MGFGIRKTLIQVNKYKNYCFYLLRKFVFGFDNANSFLRTRDKIATNFIIKKQGTLIGNDCDIETGLTFHNCVDFLNLIVGKNCHIGKSCFFDLRDKIIIEDNVVISMKTTILTHFDITKSELSKYYHKSSKEVVIKKNSYIGANSTILMGVTLNEGSFVAAGSLVIKDVEPFTMVGGVPARKIKTIERK